MNFKKLTEEEIKKLANDIYVGNVFTDRHIKNPEDVSRVFMPLVFLDEKQAKELEKKAPGMIYEYMSEASPMMINGMPAFATLRMLSREDAKKVIDKYNKIVETVKDI